MGEVEGDRDARDAVRGEPLLREPAVGLEAQARGRRARRSIRSIGSSSPRALELEPEVADPPLEELLVRALLPGGGRAASRESIPPATALVEGAGAPGRRRRAADGATSQRRFESGRLFLPLAVRGRPSFGRSARRNHEDLDRRPARAPGPRPRPTRRGARLRPRLPLRLRRPLRRHLDPHRAYRRSHRADRPRDRRPRAEPAARDDDRVGDRHGRPPRARPPRSAPSARVTPRATRSGRSVRSELEDFTRRYVEQLRGAAARRGRRDRRATVPDDPSAGAREAAADRRPDPALGLRPEGHGDHAGDRRRLDGRDRRRPSPSTGRRADGERDRARPRRVADGGSRRSTRSGPG